MRLFGLSSSQPDRRGMILYVVISLVVIMSVLIVQFHQMAMHGQRTAFRFGESESCRLLAEAGMQEAFQWINLQSDIEGSPFGEWLKDKKTAPIPFPIPLSLVNEEKPRLVNSTGNPEIKASAKILDIRLNDYDGTGYQPREANGNLEIEVSVTIQPRFLKSGATRTCKLVQHFDYLSMQLEASRPGNGARTAYTPVFPLDYALMVRNGMKDFRANAGYSLNNPNVQLDIQQPETAADPRGRIYFGGTNAPKTSTSAGVDDTPRENYVFVNLDEKSRQLIPALKTVRKEITPEQLQTLLPSWNNDTGKRWKGVFEMAAHPISKPDDLTREEDKLRKDVTESLLKFVKGAEANVSPGFQLLASTATGFPDKTEAAKILEGEIRERFLYAVSFHVEEEGSTTASGSSSQSPASSPITGFPSSMACVSDPEIHPAGSLPREFLEKLQTFPEGPKLLTSRFDASLPLCRSTEPLDFSNPSTNPPPAFPQPAFFTCGNNLIESSVSGWEGFMPYRYFNFWSPKKIPPAQLPRVGIIFPEAGMINLHGIHHIKLKEEGEEDPEPDLPEELVLGEAGKQWKISGRGVLIARKIRIRGELKKTKPDDLCVLFTPGGTITVEREQPVEAFLCSVSDGYTKGKVIISRSLNVFGGLMVDDLEFTKDESPKTVSVIFDPTGVSRNFHQIVFLHTPTFRRCTESNEEGSSGP